MSHAADESMLRGHPKYGSDGHGKGGLRKEGTINELEESPVEWLGSSLSDLRDLVSPVRSEIGQAIYAAQKGGKHSSVKPLIGDPDFRGASVLEVVADHNGNAFRAVYTVRFPRVVYVLDVFQKKSKHGNSTPGVHIARIKGRLKAASEHYDRYYRVPEPAE